MTYKEYQEYMARYGFPTCPLSENQFNEARKIGASDDDMYGIGCDVNAGVEFFRAVLINTEVYL